MAACRLPLAAARALSVEARLLNVFNNRTRLRTDSQQYLDLRMTPTPPYFAPHEHGQSVLPAPVTRIAPPRRLLISASSPSSDRPILPALTRFRQCPRKMTSDPTYGVTSRGVFPRMSRYPLNRR